MSWNLYFLVHQTPPLKIFQLVCFLALCTLPMSNDVVLKFTKDQIPDFPAVAHATSSHPVATPLQADSAVNGKGNNLTNAKLYQVAFFTAPMNSVEHPFSHLSGLPCMRRVTMTVSWLIFIPLRRMLMMTPSLSYQNCFLILLPLMILVVPSKFLSMQQSSQDLCRT